MCYNLFKYRYGKCHAFSWHATPCGMPRTYKLRIRHGVRHSCSSKRSSFIVCIHLLCTDCHLVDSTMQQSVVAALSSFRLAFFRALQAEEFTLHKVNPNRLPVAFVGQECERYDKLMLREIQSKASIYFLQ